MPAVTVIATLNGAYPGNSYVCSADLSFLAWWSSPSLSPVLVMRNTSLRLYELRKFMCEPTGWKYDTEKLPYLTLVHKGNNFNKTRYMF
jgi:hypothetical protein